MNANAQDAPANQSIGTAKFRAACGLFASGVTIVTRRLPDGSPYGMTVSSFTSVSLDPPLVLACIDRNARFLQDLAADQPFAINVLREHQQQLAARFADRNEDDRFAGIEWTPGWRDVPLVGGVVVTFACSLHQRVPSGDHLILIGEVHDIQSHKGRPLIWCDRGYHRLPDLPA